MILLFVKFFFHVLFAKDFINWTCWFQSLSFRLNRNAKQENLWGAYYIDHNNRKIIITSACQPHKSMPRSYQCSTNENIYIHTYIHTHTHSHAHHIYIDIDKFNFWYFLTFTNELLFNKLILNQDFLNKSL